MEPGFRRQQLDETLRAAYSEGLLSESTFVTRLDRVLGGVTVDPRGLVGDLTLGAARGPRASAQRIRARLAIWPRRRSVSLLALDWSGGADAPLLVGRSPDADIVLEDASVSRRHAELVWRSGTWIVHDVGSRNGTRLNGRSIARAALRPGDYITFAAQAFQLD